MIGLLAALTIMALPQGGVVVRAVPAPQVQDCASPELRAMVEQALPGVDQITAWTPQYPRPASASTLHCVALADGRQYHVTYVVNAARTQAQADVTPLGAPFREHLEQVPRVRDGARRAFGKICR